jgi:hypothetical protein
MLQCVQSALTREWPGSGISREALLAVVIPFLEWLEAECDTRVLHFCWNVMERQPRLRVRSDAPVLWLRDRGKLRGDLAYEEIELGISVAAEAHAMSRWERERWRSVTWEEVSQNYFSMLARLSYVSRGAAALGLGTAFIYCHLEGSRERPPLAASIMAENHEWEIRGPGIAGPFLCGAKWGLDDWAPFSVGFDFGPWCLETLRKSGPEPHLPQMTMLEFYAHENFAYDGSAIDAMLRMGREGLAVMTATEDRRAIPRIRPVLERMARDRNPKVSGPIRAYLAERE